MILLIFSSQTTADTSPVGLFFSDELQIGDKFSWTVEKNIKDGQDIFYGKFKVGALIQVEVIGDTEAYNHYSLFAENELSNIFSMKIDNSTFSAIFVIDFIIPVIFKFPNDTTTNFLETKLNEVIVEDELKIKTTRSINDGIYMDKIQAFNNDTTKMFSLETQFDVTTGVLHLLSIESEFFQLKIARNYEIQVEDESTEDDSSFNLIFPIFGISTMILFIYKNRKNTKLEIK